MHKLGLTGGQLRVNKDSKRTQAGFLSPHDTRTQHTQHDQLARSLSDDKVSILINIEPTELRQRANKMLLLLLNYGHHLCVNPMEDTHTYTDTDIFCARGNSAAGKQ